MRLANHFRKWIAAHPKLPAAHRATVLTGIDAYEACLSKKPLTPADLKPLVVAASSSINSVFDTGCRLLVDLARRRTEAQQSLIEMATAKSMTARFHAVCYLDKKLPAKLRLKIVQIALDDKSNKVKAKAINQALSLDLKALLPKLEEMERTETNETVQRDLAFCIPLLRDGYFLKPSEDGPGYYDITACGPIGTCSTSILMHEYSEEVVQKELAVIWYHLGCKDRRKS